MRSRLFAPFGIAAMLIVGFAVYLRLPERLPSHWNINGQVDGTMSRLAAVVFLPALTTVIWLLLLALPRIDPLRRSYAAFDSTLRLFINVIVLFMAVLYFAMLAAGLGWQFEVPRLIMICVGLLFAVLGNEMGRLKPNWFVGIRTPWTLADPEVWRRTHRVGGRVFFVAGLAIAAAGLLLPINLSGYVVLAVALGIALFSFGYSYLVWRQRTAS
jgi:uncharacterized membrane protein